jgi:hypothetical protein
MTAGDEQNPYFAGRISAGFSRHRARAQEDPGD